LIEVRHPGQKPAVITPKLQARVLDATRRKPKDGSTHWSVRKLARELRISKDAVHRIWRTAGIKPHRRCSSFPPWGMISVKYGVTTGGPAAPAAITESRIRFALPMSGRPLAFSPAP
jgi:hypothetical protein